MSLVALGGGVALYAVLYRYLARGEEGTPFLPAIEGQRIFDRVLVVLSWRWARALERLLGTERLQPQLRWCCAALVARLWPAAGRGLQWRPAALVAGRSGASPRSGWSAAPAPRRRLAGEVPPLRRARAARRRRARGLPHVRLVSAPDLALTQLIVEIVTTVLLLLGLRWLPKRSEAISGDVELPARLRQQYATGSAAAGTLRIARAATATRT